MKLKGWLLVLLAAGAFLAGYGAVATAFPTPYNRGYFHNTLDYWGDDVWPTSGGPSGCRASGGLALPNSVNTPGEFINFTFCKLDRGNTRERVGAAFIISTMTGMKDKTPDSAERNEFVQRVNYAASRGWINFGASVSMSPNTYYQGLGAGSNPTDVAAYGAIGSGAAVTFSNGSTILYAIRRECANPVGRMSPLPDAPNFNLNPTVNIEVNGGPATSGSFVEPGDLVTFHYAVNNNSSGASTSVSCTYRRATHAGYSTAPPGDVFVPRGAYCPPNRSFPGNSSTDTATEPNVPANPYNTSICRSFTISPVSQSGGSRTAQACVHVAVKPYARAYGGDLSAGGGLAASGGGCAFNSGAAIIGWNRRAGTWAGAGVQFAAYAMGRIFDTATTLGNGGGSAPRPSGLAFRNTGVDNPAGFIGGHLGSVSCIKDHYATRPASPGALTSNITPLGSGSYGASADFRMAGGNVSPGEKINIYVDGDLYIEGNIRYAGSWNSGNIPMLRLVVKGNIFIDNSVTTLDGLYVAQANYAANGTASDGVIYTCADGGQFTQLSLTGQLGSICNIKLTVNGAFVARQVRLMRTSGTLRQSSTGETASGGNMAEAFNYGPALWIVQPLSDEGGSAVYDSITSLPPIL